MAISPWSRLRMRNIRTKTVEKIENIFSVTTVRKSSRLLDNVERYGRAGQATDDNMAHAILILDN